MARILVLLASGLLNVSCFVAAHAAQLYANDFEFTTPSISGNAYRFPYPEDFRSNKMFYRGGCWRTSQGDPYDSISLSSLHVATGSRSMRVESRTDLPNMFSKNCPHSWLKKEPKVRNEIGFGSYPTKKLGEDWGEIKNGSAGQYYRYEMYIPSNEGSYSKWVKAAKPRAIVFQFLGTGNSSTPEIHGILGKDLELEIEVTQSITAAKETLKKARYRKHLLADKMNQIVFWFKRSWDEDGEFKAWINCSDWTECEATPDVDHQGGVAIRDKPISTFQVGVYRSDVDTGVAQVVYYDNVAIFDAGTKWSEITSGFSGQQGISNRESVAATKSMDDIPKSSNGSSAASK